MKTWALACLALAAMACGSGSNASSDDGGGEPNGHHDSSIGQPLKVKDAGVDVSLVKKMPEAAAKPPTGLHVSGTSIVDGDGHAVRLRGVNRSGTEYACVDNGGIFDGPSDVKSIAAIKSWNVNAVRIPLNEDCWLAINGVTAAYSGANYQKAIVDFANLLLANGVYPIVELHWNAPGAMQATGQLPMPDADHAVDFWTSVAKAFKGDLNVIFELYNEPYPDDDQDTDAAWDCWQNGGGEDVDAGDDAGPCANVGYAVAGMQSLVTAVRNTGAPNLILLGGVEFSNALTQWVTHKPDDPLNNLAAAWHIYAEEPCSDINCWNGTDGGSGAPLAVAKSFPIIATEIGDNACDPSFPVGVMTWLDSQEESYLAWVWDTFGDCSLYALITDYYDASPNGPYGAAFQTHFLAQ